MNCYNYKVSRFILGEVLTFIQFAISFFTEMPSYHYMDEAQLLLSVASDDIPDADIIRTGVKVRTELSLSCLLSFNKEHMFNND